MKSIKDRPNECFKHYASGFLVAAAESYVKNCGQKAWALAEQDLLGEALDKLRAVEKWLVEHSEYRSSDSLTRLIESVQSLLSKPPAGDKEGR